MCGRFTRAQSWAEVVAFSELPVTVEAEDLAPSWNVAPSQACPLVVARDASLVGISARWGLAPSWAKHLRQAPINARAESAAERPFFRSAFKRRRALVPADGWYEWTVHDGAKVPHWLHRADGDPLFFAGLWEPPREGADAPSFAILTRAADPEIASVHDRMPVVLERDDWRDWLELPGEARDALEAMVLAPHRDRFAHHVVSRRVNTPRNDEPALVEPVDEA